MEWQEMEALAKRAAARLNEEGRGWPCPPAHLDPLREQLEIERRPPANTPVPPGVAVYALSETDGFAVFSSRVEDGRLIGEGYPVKRGNAAGLWVVA